jgi:hypothetical protein
VRLESSTVAKVAATESTTAADQLRALRTVYDPEIDRLLAKHPNSPADLLEDLSHSADKATRRQVVRNACTPKEVLLRLAPQFPRDFLCNPVIDWMLIEEPDLLQNLGKGVLRSVLKSPTCPDALMGWATRNGNVEQQLALAMNPAATPEILETLAALKGEVGVAARAHVRYPKPSRLAKDASGQFIKAVKSSLASLEPNDAASLWRRGLIGPAQWLYLSAGSRAAVIGLPESLRGGREPDSAGCRAFAKSVSGPTSLLEFLAKHPDGAVRKVVAGNPATPPKVLQALTLDPDLAVCREVAANLRTPPLVLASLAKQRSNEWGASSVRLAAAANLSTPIDTLEALARDEVNDWESKNLKSAALRSLQLRRSLKEEESGTGRIGVRIAPVTLEVANANGLRTPIGALVQSVEPGGPAAQAGVEAGDIITLVDDLAVELSGDLHRLIGSMRPAGGRTKLQICRRGASFDVLVCLRGVEANGEVAKQRVPEVRRDVEVTSAKHPLPPTSLFEVGDRARAGLDWRSIWGRYAPASRGCVRSRSSSAIARPGSSELSSNLFMVGEDSSTSSARLRELSNRRSVALRWVLAANPKLPEDLRRELTLSLWFALGLDALPPRARVFTVELRSEVRLIMDARHWWHKLSLQARRYGYAKLPRRLPDSELVERFQSELKCFARNPQASLAAEVIGANGQSLFRLNDRADTWGRRPVSLALKLRLREREEPFASQPVGLPRLFALLHPNAPVKALVKAYRSVDWMERMAVARNPSAPAKMLAALKKDANRFVARQAADTEALQQELQQWPALAIKLHDRWQLSLTGLTSGTAVWDGFEGETSELLGLLRAHRNALEPLSTQQKASPSINRVVAEIGLRLHDQRLMGVLWRDPQWVNQLGVSTLWEHIRWNSIDTLPGLKATLSPQEWNRFWALGAALPDDFTRAAIAGHPLCPADTFQALVADGSPEVLAALVRNPQVDPGLQQAAIQRVLDSDASTKVRVAAHPLTPVSLLEELARSSSDESRVRQQVARNPGAPPHVLELLSRDQETHVRAEVTANPSADLALLESLAREPGREIQQALLKNPKTSTPLLENAMQVVGRNWWTLPLEARHPATTVERLTELATDLWPDSRLGVASNPSTPAAVLGALSRDSKAEVREAVAGMAGLPDDAVARLAADRVEAVRVQVARRENLARDILKELVRDKSAKVREAVACHPKLEAEVVQALLASLAKDAQSAVRAAVARHPAMTEQLLEVLANDDVQEVRVAATGRRLRDELAEPLNELLLSQLASAIRMALLWIERKDDGQANGSSWTPESLLRGLFGLHLIPQRPSARFLAAAAKSKDWLTRLAVALHPLATPAHLKLLEKDEVPDVVAAVRSRTTGNWAH